MPDAASPVPGVQQALGETECIGGAWLSAHLWGTPFKLPRVLSVALYFKDSKAPGKHVLLYSFESE